MTNSRDSIDVERFPRIDLRKTFAHKPQPLDFVLPGMITGTVGALVAQGGAGKSWAALQMAIAVAGGPNLLEIDLDRAGPVLYLPAEDPTLAIEHRLYASGRHIDEAERDILAERLEIVPLIGQAVDLMSDAWAAGIERMAKGKRLVVIDTLRRFHSADENSAGDMARLLGIMERICGATGASILFLHHTAKGAALNGAGDQQQASRGSSVLVDNVRGGQYNLSGMTEGEARAHGIDPGARRGYVRMVQAKANFGAPMPDMWLKRADGGILLPAGIERIDDDARGTKGTRAKGRSGRSSV